MYPLSGQVWFDRRTNFSRSLAVMSMVGYVLGLGDRHPSNLLIDRNSGKLLHIDFGDCFEVCDKCDRFLSACTRPFRLNCSYSWFNSNNAVCPFVSRLYHLAHSVSVFQSVIFFYLRNISFIITLIFTHFSYLFVC